MTKKNYPPSCKLINPKLAFSISAIFFLSSCISLLAAVQNEIIRVNIGVVLDLNTKQGKFWLSCIEMALLDLYGSHAHYKTRLVLNTRNSNQNVVGAAAAATDLIKNAQVRAILGPTTSMQARFVINLGEQAHVPILSFSATSPSLASIRSSYFFRFAENDASQVKALSDVVKSFGWRQVVLVYIDNEFGEGVIPYLTDALYAVHARVVHRTAISSSASDAQIIQQLCNLKKMQTRVFIVHMSRNLAFRMFSKAKELGMISQGYVWLSTNGITDDSMQLMNASTINSMQGLLGVQTYVPITNSTSDDVQLDVYGVWAYDAATALAMAVEKVWNTSLGSQEMDESFSFGLKVSNYGTKLCQALLVTRFEGLGGHITLVNRELQASTFQIVNVDHDGVKAIGSWTARTGLVYSLNSSTDSKTKILWPGDSKFFPKGWEIPISGKKLRVGVPAYSEFPDLLTINKDPGTNTTEVTGFCADVFKAAVEILPYDLPYEFIPFAKPDGTSAGTYNDLVYQVYLGNFDAAVGDITIRVNRSLYVDFTIPYTDSSIVMVVPIKDTKTKNAWAFLKPLTRDLWLTIFCLFIFNAFVVWVLEHRINEGFRGPPSYQVGTSVSFSFSTMVFSHSEKVISNLARFVMIIWVFIMLILTQSYTANLSSVLTVQQLQPTVTSIWDLMRNGESIGYLKNSYTYGMLKQLGFDDSKLKPFTTMEEFDEALMKGSENGGIAAVVDENPTMKIFLIKYCSKYTMIGPILKTEGFGFVFPKRSPLLPDISHAVINVTEGENIMKFENRWFKKGRKCEYTKTPKETRISLGLDSFWGLFLIVGVAFMLALIIFVASFTYKHKHVLLLHPDSRVSKWGRIRALLEIFNEKDLDSYTLRNSHQQRTASPNSTDFPSVSSEEKLPSANEPLQLAVTAT